MTLTFSQPWWMTDEYDITTAIPGVFPSYSGPHGIALVRAYEDGRTDSGWGLNGKDGAPGFIEKYDGGQFTMKPVLVGYGRDIHNFAFVMRSMRMVCIDIDGKNGGFEHAKKLGYLPPTLAETSKSGNGYHLFYLVEDEWDPTKGYGKFRDRIGIKTGVDIRGAGCVYHHKTQRWNSRELALLPDHLEDLLLTQQQAQLDRAGTIVSVLNDGDELEILMMQEELISRLKQDMPAGKRNNTLFAIGQDMKKAGIEEWNQYIADRANEVGLDAVETTQLIKNIENYG